MFDIDLAKSQGIEPSSDDLECNSLECIGSQFECAKWVDSNPSIETQLHSPLFIVPPGSWRLNIHNALPSALQTSLFTCWGDTLQFQVSTPTPIINNQLWWTQGNGDGNHEHNENVHAFKTTQQIFSRSSRPRKVK